MADFTSKEFILHDTKQTHVAYFYKSAYHQDKERSSLLCLGLEGDIQTIWKNKDNLEE